jgi:hypothetical protein
MFNDFSHEVQQVLPMSKAEFKSLSTSIEEPGLEGVSGIFVPVGRLISGLYHSLKVAVGPIKHWIRIGDSFSKSGKFQTKAIRWGTNRHYRQQIGNNTLRKINESLHNTRLPIKGWRTQDSGHLHLYNIEDKNE